MNWEGRIIANRKIEIIYIGRYWVWWGLTYLGSATTKLEAESLAKTWFFNLRKELGK